MREIIVSAVFFMLIYGSAVAAWATMSARRRATDCRFADLAVKVRISDRTYVQGAFGRRLLRWAMDRIPKPDPESPRTEKLGQTLTQAGLLGSSAVNQFYVVRAALAAGTTAVGGLAGLILGHSQADIAVSLLCGASIGFIVPHYYIKRRARLRQATIASQLSEVLDLLVVAVESGLGLNEAIKIVGVESDRQHQVIGRELAQVSGEIAAGKSMGDALRSLAERTAVEDIKPLAATLIQSEQLGGQIGPALRASSDALRDARRLHAEEAAQKLSVKVLFPLVLLVLPAMLMLILGPAMMQIVKALNQ